MPQPIHSRLINTAARQILTPFGLHQKGQSRLWFDDHGWWLILVEFQPDNRKQGTYLNIGINWLWFDRNYFAYDMGGRTGSFVAFETEGQFNNDLQKMGNGAVEQVKRYRQKFPSIESVARDLAGKWRKDNWDLYHAGMACALCGKKSQAIKFFDELTKKPCQYDWEKNLSQKAGQLSQTLMEGNEIHDLAAETVIETRRQLQLKPLDTSFAFEITR